MNFSITDHHIGEVHLVAVGGELDLYASPAVRRHLIALIKAGQRRLVVDLGHASFIDSTAVGVLVSTARRARDAGGSFDLICDNPHILRVLDFIGTERCFLIHRSLAAAGLAPTESPDDRHSSASPSERLQHLGLGPVSLVSGRK